MKQHLINHIGIALDGSGSIGHIKFELGKVCDSLVEYLAKESQSKDQETRLSIYRFSRIVENMYFDIDALRVPKIGTDFYIGNDTALIDAANLMIDDLTLTCQKYGDHAFLLYVLTDGQNNINNYAGPALSQKINNLPDNWTVAALVPNDNGIVECVRYGFPRQNVKVWDQNVQGVKDVGSVISVTTSSFMANRAKGIRGSKNLFQLNTSNLNSNTVKTALQQLDPKEYLLLKVSKDSPIKDFVESWKVSYVPGSAYYELTKPEKVQHHKQVIVQDRKNGKLYSGSNARQILGLPDYEVKVSPASHANHRIFVQSTSVNRKLVKGTELVVLK